MMTAPEATIEGIHSDNSRSNESSMKKRSRRNPERKRHGARNQHKSKHFIRWLVERFVLLPHGPPILDVAGGKAEVASRLCMCHGCNVIMVDPRPANPVDCFEQLVVPKLPNKWQERLQRQQKDNPDFYSDKIAERFHQLVMYFDSTTVKTCPELKQAVQDCALMIGMHADGATEAIVDVALQHHKPFVVVPCCVFPNLFSQRRITQKDGTIVPVRTHEQFCQYLLEKDDRFQMEVLPFEGRNVAIWWDGKR